MNDKEPKISRDDIEAGTTLKRRTKFRVLRFIVISVILFLILAVAGLFWFIRGGGLRDFVAGKISGAAGTGVNIDSLELMGLHGARMKPLEIEPVPLSPHGPVSAEGLEAEFSLFKLLKTSFKQITFNKPVFYIDPNIVRYGSGGGGGGYYVGRLDLVEPRIMLRFNSFSHDITAAGIQIKELSEKGCVLAPSIINIDIPGIDDVLIEADLNFEPAFSGSTEMVLKEVDITELLGYFGLENLLPPEVVPGTLSLSSRVSYNDKTLIIDLDGELQGTAFFLKKEPFEFREARIKARLTWDLDSGVITVSDLGLTDPGLGNISADGWLNYTPESPGGQLELSWQDIPLYEYLNYLDIQTSIPLSKTDQPVNMAMKANLSPQILEVDFEVSGDAGYWDSLSQGLLSEPVLFRGKTTWLLALEGGPALPIITRLVFPSANGDINIAFSYDPPSGIVSRVGADLKGLKPEHLQRTLIGRYIHEAMDGLFDAQVTYTGQPGEDYRVAFLLEGRDVKIPVAEGDIETKGLSLSGKARTPKSLEYVDLEADLKIPETVLPGKLGPLNNVVFPARLTGAARYFSGPGNVRFNHFNLNTAEIGELKAEGEMFLWLNKGPGYDFNILWNDLELRPLLPVVNSFQESIVLDELAGSGRLELSLNNLEDSAGISGRLALKDLEIMSENVIRLSELETEIPFEYNGYIIETDGAVIGSASLECAGPYRFDPALVFSLPRLTARASLTDRSVKIGAGGEIPGLLDNVEASGVIGLDRNSIKNASVLMKGVNLENAWPVIAGQMPPGLADWMVMGTMDAGIVSNELSLLEKDQQMDVKAELTLKEGGVLSPDGLKAVENLAGKLAVNFSVAPMDKKLGLAWEGEFSNFQALWEAYFLDFSGRKLRYKGEARLNSDTLAVERIDTTAAIPDLGGVTVEYADKMVRLESEKMSLAVLYSLFLREMAAAGLPSLSDLAVDGRLSFDLGFNSDSSEINGRLGLKDGVITIIEPSVDIVGLDLELPLNLDFGRSEAAAGEESWEPGRLEIRKLTAPGVEAEKTVLNFSMGRNSFKLDKPFSLPLFGGGITVKALEAKNLLDENLDLVMELEGSGIDLERITGFAELIPLPGTVSFDDGLLLIENGDLYLSGSLKVHAFDGVLTVTEFKAFDFLSQFPVWEVSCSIDDLNLTDLTRRTGFGLFGGVIKGTVTGLSYSAGQLLGFEIDIESVKKSGVKQIIDINAVKNIASMSGFSIPSAIVEGAKNYGYSRFGFTARLKDGKFNVKGKYKKDGQRMILVGSLFNGISIYFPDQVVSFKSLMSRMKDLMSRDYSQVEIDTK